MNNLKKQLSLKYGISLAFGSIIGSGILFLPSMTYFMNGEATFWVWIIATFLCIPLVYIFSDMVSYVPNESGIEGFISLGLGKHIGATVPIILLCTISFGMPSSALIAGEYVKNFIGGNTIVQVFTASFIVFNGVIINLMGIKASSILQAIITILIILVSISFIMCADPVNLKQVKFSMHELKVLFPGIVLAFWAFAGFENLTFIAGEFKNPSRDIKLSMLVALFLSGLLYLLLSESFASHIAQQNVNPLSGLFQLSSIIYSKSLGPAFITLFAILAVQINFTSWIWGISRLIYSSARQNKLPAYFSLLNHKQIPARAIYLLGMIFTFVLLIFLYLPKFLSTVLIVVSTNFVFIYMLCLISYILYKKWSVLRVIAMGLLILLIKLLLSSKWLLLYPTTLFGAAAVFSWLRQRNGRNNRNNNTISTL